MADADVAALERVFSRLVVATDDRLESILETLLPRLLPLLNKAATRPKVLEIVTHLRKRLGAFPEPRLPMHSLAQLLHSDGPFVRNFSLLFLKMGAKGPLSNLPELIYTLLDGLSRLGKTPFEDDKSLGISILCLVTQLALKLSEPMGSGFLGRLREPDVLLFRLWFLHFMQVEGCPERERTEVSAPVEQEEGESVSPLLMLSSGPIVRALSRNFDNWAPEAHVERKLGLLHLITIGSRRSQESPGEQLNDAATDSLLPTAEVLALLMTASQNANSVVATRATELLSPRVRGLRADSQKEGQQGSCGEVELAKRLVELLMEKASPEEGQGFMLPHRVRLKLFECVSRYCPGPFSRAEESDGRGLHTRAFALALEALLGQGSRSQLRQNGADLTPIQGQSSRPQLRKTGAEFALFLVSKFPDVSLAKVGRHFATAAMAVLRRFLTDRAHGVSVHDFAAVAAQRACRIACYSVCDVVCQRQGIDGLGADFCDMLSLFLALLEGEEEDVVLSVTAMLGSLRESYSKGKAMPDFGRFEQIVLSMGTADSAKLRHQVVSFGTTVLPFTHVAMRKLCVVLASDPDRSVRAAALQGLVPSSEKSKYPPFSEMVYELLPPTGSTLLNETDNSLAVGLQFLLHCLQQDLKSVVGGPSPRQTDELERTLEKLKATGLLTKNPVLSPLIHRQPRESAVAELFATGRGYNYDLSAYHWTSWVTRESDVGVSVEEALRIYLHAIVSGIKAKTPQTAIVSAEVLATFVFMNVLEVVSKCGLGRHISDLRDIAIGSEGTRPILSHVLAGIIGAAMPHLPLSLAEETCKLFANLIKSHARQISPNPGRENRVRAAMLGLGYLSLYLSSHQMHESVLVIANGVIPDLIEIVDSSKARDKMANDAAAALGLIWLRVEPFKDNLADSLPRLCQVLSSVIKSYAGTKSDLEEKSERTTQLITTLGCACIGLAGQEGADALQMLQQLLDACLTVPGPFSLAGVNAASTDAEPCTLMSHLPYEVSFGLGSALSAAVMGLPDDTFRDVVECLCRGPAKSSSLAARGLGAVYLLSLVSLKDTCRLTSAVWDVRVASLVQEALLHIVQNPGASGNANAELASETAFIALYKLYHEVATDREESEVKRMQNTLLVDLCRVLKLYSSSTSSSTTNIQSLGSEDHVDASAFIQSMLEALASDNAERSNTDVRTDPSFAPLAIRELCRVAVDAGFPQSIYALLTLTAEHEAWQTPEGGRLSLPSIGGAVVKGLPPSRVLLPIVFVRKYDPNATIKSVMVRLWTYFTTDTSDGALLREHFTRILQHCMSYMDSPKWRERECAAAALGDLLNWARGLGVDRAGPGVFAQNGSHAHVIQTLVEKLSEIWPTCLTLAEDSRESTVLSAMKCCRSMANFSSMICSPWVSQSETNERSIENIKRRNPYALVAVKAVLPHLMGERVRSRSNAAKAACVFGLMKVITSSIDAVDSRVAASSSGSVANPWTRGNPEVVRINTGIFSAKTFVELVEALVSLQSDLESDVLPYLQNQLAFQEEYGAAQTSSASTFTPAMSAEGFEEERLRLNASAPLAECLQRLIQFTPDDSKVPLLRTLPSTLLHSSGLASRSAAADVLVIVMESLGKRDDRIVEEDLSESLSAISSLANGVLDCIFKERSPALRRRFQRVLTVCWGVLELDGVHRSVQKLVDKYQSLRVDEDDVDVDVPGSGEDSKLLESDKGLSDFARQKLTVAKLVKSLLTATSRLWSGQKVESSATYRTRIPAGLSVCLGLAFACRFESGRIGAVWAEVFVRLKEILDISDQELHIAHATEATAGSWICSLVRLLVKLLVSRGYNARKRGCLAVSALCGGGRRSSATLSNQWEPQLAHMQRLVFNALCYASSRGTTRAVLGGLHLSNAFYLLGRCLARKGRSCESTSPHSGAWTCLGAGENRNAPDVSSDMDMGIEQHWDCGLVSDFVAAQRLREDMEAQRWQPGRAEDIELPEPSDEDILGETEKACPRVQLPAAVGLLLCLADPTSRGAIGESGGSKVRHYSSDEEDKVCLAAVHALARICRALKEHPQIGRIQERLAEELKRHLAYGLGVSSSAGAESAATFSSRMKPEHVSSLLVTLGNSLPPESPIEAATVLLRYIHWVFTQNDGRLLGEDARDSQAADDSMQVTRGAAYAFPWNIRVAALKSMLKVIQVCGLSVATDHGVGALDLRRMILDCLRHSLVIEGKHVKVREAGARALLALLDSTALRAIPGDIHANVSDLVAVAVTDRVPSIHELGRRCEEALQKYSKAFSEAG